jgi:hypothetical protein
MGKLMVRVREAIDLYLESTPARGKALEFVGVQRVTFA